MHIDTKEHFFGKKRRLFYALRSHGAQSRPITSRIVKRFDLTSKICDKFFSSDLLILYYSTFSHSTHRVVFFFFQRMADSESKNEKKRY